MGRSLTGPGNVARSGDSMLGAFNEAKGNDIASTSVVNLVIATGNLIDITGGNTILSMVLASGAERVLRFTGSLRLTNSSVLVCPGGADIITLAGDFATVRGYPGGVVRIVVYTRATGYVQRIGDQLLGNLTLTPGTNTVAPLKYQAGVLTGITIPHACEWNGSNLFMVNAGGVRKQLLYADDSAAQLTGLTSLQVTNALGYTPFNAGTTPSTISPAGGLMEVGRYIDFHAVDSSNDYDARIEIGVPSGGPGSSVMNLAASSVQVTGSAVWTQASLTNLSQLTNGPSYASMYNPDLTNPNVLGHITVPLGILSDTSIRFFGVGTSTGFTGIGTSNFCGVVAGKNALDFSVTGVKFPAGFNTGISINGGALILEKDPASSLSGDVIVGTTAQRMTVKENGGTGRGAYLDLALCDPSAATRILTTKDTGTYSLSTTGYTKFPNGLIMQWGKKSGGTGFASFPMTFPTAVINVQTCYDRSNSAGSYGSAYSASLSGVNVYNDACDTWWMALGY